MDSATKVTRENESHPPLVTSENLNHIWFNGSQNTTNSKRLFISVEYLKDSNEYKFTPAINYPEDSSCADFVQHINPLDPNMSSTACYSQPSSPHCSNADIAFNNALVVQNLLSASMSDEHLITRDANTYVDHLTVSHDPSQNISHALPNCDQNLIKEVATDKYLLNENGSSSGVLQLVSGSETEHEVELLITDQVTGISYNISTQEYLVERCLEDEQHLLDALTPTHFLDNDLLGIDDASLKSELSDTIESIHSTEPLQQDTTNNNNLVNSAPFALAAHMSIKTENYEDDCDYVYNQENLRRSHRRLELQNIENEEQLLADVQAISDKPIETRARATLPASYLAIVKQSGDQYGVIARKLIPRCTQFGPVEGLLVVNNREVNNNALQLLVDCGTGSIHRLDVSDENVSNWMCFVRKASTYSEQNLLLTQLGNSLFYITTVNVMPKQELRVGYSLKYAKQYNLSFLKPIPEKNKVWPCFECNHFCQSSADLQNHLNIHDGIEKSNYRLKKNLKKKRIKKEYKKYLIECKFCMETFSFSFKDYSVLSKHSMKHCNADSASVEDNFSIICYNCEKCGLSFEIEDLLEIHNLQHKVNNNTVLINLICPKCQKTFDTQAQLIEHVNYHCRDKYAPIISSKGFKCPICYKIFASDERIQRHMFVHGSEDSKPFKCDICSKRFLNNSALTCHLKIHSADHKHFECPICKDSFDQVVLLKAHVNKHRIDGKYTCPHCKKVFNEYSIIRKHIRAFHCDRKHNCSYCTKPFPTLDKLRMHLLRHSDHKEFLCADCGKQFKRKDKLKEHTKRMHSEKLENIDSKSKVNSQNKRFTPKVLPTEYHRFIYKCHTCLVGFKRRGMLVNHLAKQHPDIRPDSVPELNLPILRTTRDYYCQYCDKIYKSSSKRKAHILKNHPGQALPLSNRRHTTYPDVSGLPNPTFSTTVGSITTPPQSCQWCHKQYASKAKLLQHQRKKHPDLVQIQLDTVQNSREASVPNYNQDVMNVDLDEASLKKEIKFLQVAAEEVLSKTEVVLNEERDDQYYQIISVSSSNSTTNYTHASGLNSGRGSPDSRLYFLLTTGNGLVHQPPR